MTKPIAVRIDGAAPAIRQCPTASLTPYAGNARSHSARQIRQIADSITRFGFTNPVLIDGAGGIVAGHGRVAAAKLLGLGEVPTLSLAHLSDAERRAYVLADNKLAENAGWDRDLLAIELQGLLEIGFDLELTGFSLAEIDFTLDAARDRRPEAPEREPLRLPRHRLPQADADRLLGAWHRGARQGQAVVQQKPLGHDNAHIARHPGLQALNVGPGRRKGRENHLLGLRQRMSGQEQIRRDRRLPPVGELAPQDRQEFQRHRLSINLVVRPRAATVAENTTLR